MFRKGMRNNISTFACLHTLPNKKTSSYSQHSIPSFPASPHSLMSSHPAPMYVVCTPRSYSHSCLLYRNKLKRKVPDTDSNTDPDEFSIKFQTDNEPPTSTTTTTPSSSSKGLTTTNTAGSRITRTDEYKAGRVVCEACGISVLFRDSDSGEFTVKQWETHRATW